MSGYYQFIEKMSQSSQKNIFTEDSLFEKKIKAQSAGPQNLKQIIVC